MKQGELIIRLGQLTLLGRISWVEGLHYLEHGDGILPARLADRSIQLRLESVYPVWVVGCGQRRKSGLSGAHLDP